MARVEELSVDACLTLLEQHHVGRLAVVDEEGPLIHPVNYLMDQGAAVLRSDHGLKVDQANARGPAAFEIDGVDHTRRLGWSVLVRGRLTQITDPGELERLDATSPEPYVGGDKVHLLRLESGRITGRRITVPPEIPAGRMDAVALGNVWRGRDGDDLLA